MVYLQVAGSEEMGQDQRLAKSPQIELISDVIKTP